MPITKIAQVLFLMQVVINENLEVKQFNTKNLVLLLSVPTQKCILYIHFTKV